MNSYISKRLFQGFICLHILHHAVQEPVYGSWLMDELAEHGYKLSPGTLYPILHSLENEGLLAKQDLVVHGKVRKYYHTTELGEKELQHAKGYLFALVEEIGLGRKEEIDV